MVDFTINEIFLMILCHKMLMLIHHYSCNIFLLSSNLKGNHQTLWYENQTCEFHIMFQMSLINDIIHISLSIHNRRSTISLDFLFRDIDLIPLISYGICGFFSSTYMPSLAVYNGAIQYSRNLYIFIFKTNKNYAHFTY